jgi:hypothetical protein
MSAALLGGIFSDEVEKLADGSLMISLAVRKILLSPALTGKLVLHVSQPRHERVVFRVLQTIVVATSPITGNERDHRLNMGLTSKKEPQRSALLDLTPDEQEDIQEKDGPMTEAFRGRHLL